MNINKTVVALKKNHMNAAHITSRDMLMDVLKDLIPSESTVGYGGSETLNQLGIKEWLRTRTDIHLFDRDLSDDRVGDMKKSLTSDVFLMSSNAITERGELFNIDGNGNRIAALSYGPDKVIVICGKNKIVKDLKEAEQRLKSMAAPLNAKRLNKNTPCAETGHCADCQSDDRICGMYLVTKQPMIKDRITVLILDETLGY